MLNNGPKVLEEAAAAIDRVIRAKCELRHAEEKLEKDWTEWGKPLWMARYLVDDLIKTAPAPAAPITDKTTTAAPLGKPSPSAQVAGARSLGQSKD